MPWTLHMKERFSLTLNEGATAVSWGETPILSLTRRGEVMMLSPDTMASPPDGLVRVDSIFIVVVFPAPLTPNRANNSPSIISRSRLSTAVRSLYFLVRPLVVIA